MRKRICEQKEKSYKEEKVTALKQDPEKQPWSDGVIELFRVMQESCAKNIMATLPEPCVWQNWDPFIPSSPVSGW